jgi:hypothetical protein
MDPDDFQLAFDRLLEHPRLGNIHVNLESLVEKFDLEDISDLPDDVAENGGADSNAFATRYELYVIQDNLDLCNSDRLRFYQNGSNPNRIRRLRATELLDDFC